MRSWFLERTNERLFFINDNSCVLPLLQSKEPHSNISEYRNIWVYFFPVYANTLPLPSHDLRTFQYTGVLLFMYAYMLYQAIDSKVRLYQSDDGMRQFNNKLPLAPSRNKILGFLYVISRPSAAA